jgi:hypothetical protein
MDPARCIELDLVIAKRVGIQRGYACVVLEKRVCVVFKVVIERRRTPCYNWTGAGGHYARRVFVGLHRIHADFANRDRGDAGCDLLETKEHSRLILAVIHPVAWDVYPT